MLLYLRFEAIVQVHRCHCVVPVYTYLWFTLIYIYMCINTVNKTSVFVELSVYCGGGEYKLQLFQNKGTCFVAI